MSLPTETSPYRAASSPASVVRSWRDYATISICALGSAWYFALGVSGSTRVELHCDRSAGTCRLDETTLFGTSSKDLALASIRGARSFFVNTGKHAAAKHAVELLTTAAPVRLPDGNAPDNQRVAVVPPIQTFLESTTQPRLDVAYGHADTWADVGKSGFEFALMMIAVLLLRPGVRIYAAEGVLVFEVRPWGPLVVTKRRFELAHAGSAWINKSRRGGSVVLAMRDGSTRPLGYWAFSTRGASARLRDRIDEVIASARQDAS
jgi:hypothetical protein